MNRNIGSTHPWLGDVTKERPTVFALFALLFSHVAFHALSGKVTATLQSMHCLVVEKAQRGIFTNESSPVLGFELPSCLSKPVANPCPLEWDQVLGWGMGYFEP